MNNKAHIGAKAFPIRIISGAALLCGALCLCGCVYHTELSDRAIVQAVGVDYLSDSDLFRISLQYFSQSSEGGQNQIDKTQDNALKAVGEGKSITEAALNASVDTGKDLLLSENRLIIMGNEACKADLSSILEFFISNYHSHPEAHIAAAEKTAEEIIDIRFKEGYVSAIHLTDMISNACEKGKAADSRLYAVMRGLCGTAGGAYLPLLKITELATDNTIPPENGGSSGEGGSGGSGGEEADGSGSKKEKTVVIDGGVIFKDRKAAGRATKEISGGIQLLCKNAKEYTLTSALDEGGSFTAVLYGIKTDIVPKITEGALSFEIFLTATARTQPDGRIIGGADSAAQYAEAANEEIKRVLTKTTDYVKGECASDVFGLENAVRHRYPDFYKKNRDKINELIIKAEYSVYVDIKPIV